MAGIYFSDDNQTPEQPGATFGALYWKDDTKRWYQQDSAGNELQLLTSADGGGGSGDVVGPASATDNAIARFDTTTGKLIQNSVVTISNSGVMAGISQLDVDNVRVDGNTINVTNLNGDLNLNGNGTGAAIVNGVTLINSGGGTQFLADDGTYQTVGGGGSGDVVGPASATNDALARFDTTTGKLIQNSVGILTDVGALSGLTQLNVDNIELNGNTINVTNTNGNLTLDGNGTGNAIVNGVTLETGGASDSYLSQDGSYQSLPGGSVFGSNYQKVESLSVSSTTSTTPQSKLVLNTPSIPAGDYKILVSLQWNHSDTGNYSEITFEVDSTEERFYRQEVTSTNGDDPPGTGNELQLNITSTITKTFASAGTHSVEILYNTSESGKTTSVWNAVIEFWRVA